MNERLETLETKISYQEHLLQELNEVIVSQQNQIDDLSKTLKQLKGMLESGQPQTAYVEQEAPPPHY